MISFMYFFLEIGGRVSRFFLAHLSLIALENKFVIYFKVYHHSSIICFRVFMSAKIKNGSIDCDGLLCTRRGRFMKKIKRPKKKANEIYYLSIIITYKVQ